MNEVELKQYLNLLNMMLKLYVLKKQNKLLFFFTIGKLLISHRRRLNFLYDIKTVELHIASWF